MELRQLRARGYQVGRYFREPKNLVALCKLCHDALDCKLKITEWYILKFSGIRVYDALMKHYDRHLYGFQRILHRRNLVLVELPA